MIKLETQQSLISLDIECSTTFHSAIYDHIPSILPPDISVLKDHFTVAKRAGLRTLAGRIAGLIVDGQKVLAGKVVKAKTPALSPENQYALQNANRKTRRAWLSKNRKAA